MWKLLLNYIEARCFVGAAGGKDMGSKKDDQNAGGLNGEQLNEGMRPPRRGGPAEAGLAPPECQPPVEAAHASRVRCNLEV